MNPNYKGDYFPGNSAVMRPALELSSLEYQLGHEYFENILQGCFAAPEMNEIDGQTWSFACAWRRGATFPVLTGIFLLHG